MGRRGFDGGSVSWRIVSSKEGVTRPCHTSRHVIEVLHRPVESTQAGFQRSSQLLDSDELRWDKEGLSAAIVRCVLLCARRAGLQAGAGNTFGSSGQGSLAVSQARMRPSPAVSRRRSAGAGSVKLAACEPSAPIHLPAVTCLSLSERRSRLVIKSVFATLKRQMRMEDHLAKTLPGLAQRLLALTLGILGNTLLGRPARALAAYDGR